MLLVGATFGQTGGWIAKNHSTLDRLLKYPAESIDRVVVTGRAVLLCVSTRLGRAIGFRNVAGSRGRQFRPGFQNGCNELFPIVDSGLLDVDGVSHADEVDVRHLLYCGSTVLYCSRRTSQGSSFLFNESREPRNGDAVTVRAEGFPNLLAIGL